MEKPTMNKFIVLVTQEIEVTLDKTKFDEAFMEEFRQNFYSFDTIEEHAEHIAQLQARGVYELDSYNPEFIEGYGPQSEMGIKARSLSTEMDIVSPYDGGSHGN
jgi:hypothetical protein